MNFLRTYNNIFQHWFDTLFRVKRYAIIVSKNDDCNILLKFKQTNYLVIGRADFENDYMILFFKVPYSMVREFYRCAMRIYSIHSISGDKEYFKACDMILNMVKTNYETRKCGIKSIQEENKAILQHH